jgi:hypothetical protein
MNEEEQKIRKAKFYKGAMVIQAFFLTCLRGLFWRCPGSSVGTSA